MRLKEYYVKHMNHLYLIDWRYSVYGLGMYNKLMQKQRIVLKKL